METWGRDLRQQACKLGSSPPVSLIVRPESYGMSFREDEIESAHDGKSIVTMSTFSEIIGLPFIFPQEFVWEIREAPGIPMWEKESKQAYVFLFNVGNSK